MDWNQIEPEAVLKTLEEIRLRQIVTGVIEVLILATLVLIIMVI
jgi:hypothetical protein